MKFSHASGLLWLHWGAGLCLFAVAFIIYSPILGPGYQFILFDDPMYVLKNHLVLGGFTPENIWAAFSQPNVSNYHPLTMLSLMLDFKLKGDDPAAFRLTSILFHGFNAALVFRFFSVATGYYGRSFFVALFFAVHPSRVESVAWVSERKDVLFLFFWLLASISYVKWVKSGNSKSLVPCILLFLASLMSKPMAVTFPFALMLLDLWPLGRYGEVKDWRSALARAGGLMWEKLPLLLLTFLFCLATVWAQEGAMAGTDTGSTASTWANTTYSYATYLTKTLFPTEQAIFYPYQDLSIFTVAWAVSLLLLVSVLAVSRYRSMPYILVGWLLFLGTMVPAIGIVQVGSQAMADRYMYLSGLPLLMVIVWLAADLASSSRIATRLLQGGGAAVAILYASSTMKYLEKWRDTESIFNHSILVTGDTFLHLGLGNFHMHAGEYRKAATHYAAFLKGLPAGKSGTEANYAWIWGNLGYVVAKLEDWENSKRFTEKALEADRNLATAWWNMAVVSSKMGSTDEAQAAERRYRRLRPADGREIQEVRAIYKDD